MSFARLYEYLFAGDAFLFTKAGVEVVVRVGDKVHVFSQRYDRWFTDGIVVATFRDCIKCQYGFEKHFGWSLTRSNIKCIYTDDIAVFLKIPEPSTITQMLPP
jgi:hypothetical protein